MALPIKSFRICNKIFRINFLYCVGEFCFMFGSVKHQQWILFPTVSVYHSLPLPLFLCLCVHYACVRVSVCHFVFVCLFSLLWKVDWSQGSFCFSTFVASLSWAFKSASAVTGFKVENFRDRKCSLYTKAITTTSIQNQKVHFFGI